MKQPSDKPRVAIVGHSYLALENRKSIAQLARQFEIEVISPATWKDGIFEYDPGTRSVEGDGWRIRFYGSVVPPGLPSAAYLLRSFTLGLRKFKPDILHIECDPFIPVFIQAWLWSRLWAPQSRIVCTVKQNTYTSRGRIVDGIKDWFGRRLQTKVSRFIVVNKGVAEIYRDRFGVETSRMAPITHMGVDTALFSPGSAMSASTSDDLVFGYVGRLDEHKGVQDLLLAMKFARERTGRNLRLALLGGGLLKDALSRSAREYDWFSVSEPVPHAEVADFLRTLDAFVMPSRVLEFHVEHDGHAVLEAMACGLATIGTDSGAIPEVLAECGLIVQDSNPEELAAAIVSLASDAKLRTTLGQKARRRVLEEYSLEAVAVRYGEVYRSVLSAGAVK